MRFSRQEYWSGLPFLSPGDLPDLGIKPKFLALQADTLPSKQPGKLYIYIKQQITYKGIPVGLSADFSAETLQARREWHDIVE